jgi:hypothetical protein
MFYQDITRSGPHVVRLPRAERRFTKDAKSGITVQDPSFVVSRICAHLEFPVGMI